MLSLSLTGVGGSFDRTGRLTGGCFNQGAFDRGGKKRGHLTGGNIDRGDLNVHRLYSLQRLTTVMFVHYV